MIVRSWHGIVPSQKAEGFKNYLIKTGVTEAKAISGCAGAYIYNQTQGEYEHFFMVSYWDNIEAVNAFAGPEPQIAVTYPEDDMFCLISDPIVLHHEVQNVPAEFPIK